MTGGSDRVQTPGARATKEEWRAWAREQRLGLDPRALGIGVGAQLEAWNVYRDARNVLAYLAFGGEPDLAPLLTATGSKCFYVTRTGDSDDLSLHELDFNALEPHRFGFLQPRPAAPPVAADVIDLALVPGLAFDRLGNRLGFGRGYYDRLLSTLPVDTPRVGVTPSGLLVPRLPVEPHDVRMTHLVTEGALLPSPG